MACALSFMDDATSSKVKNFPPFGMDLLLVTEYKSLRLPGGENISNFPFRVISPEIPKRRVDSMGRRMKIGVAPKNDQGDPSHWITDGRMNGESKRHNGSYDPFYQVVSEHPPILDLFLCGRGSR
jgi:hypothetical protein